MSIIRVKKTTEYVVIDNRTVCDKTLSWAARGMLSYLLSKPDDWTVRVNDLIAQSPAGRDATRKILRELKEHKYMVRKRVNAGGGKFKWETEIHERPTIDVKGVDGETTDGQTIDGEGVDLPSKESPNTEDLSSKPKRKRKRDPLFDAIAQVCGVDPATAGASIGKVKSALMKADPPYTPDEVREFARRWNMIQWNREHRPLTVWILREQIGRVRMAAPSDDGADQYSPEAIEARKREVADLKAGVE